MEALVVVAIIAISAAVAAPAIGNAMADRRANEAAQKLVRIAARGQSEAQAYGRAHLLRYVNFSSGPSAAEGSVQLWRGISNLCTTNNWATIISGTCATDPECIDEIDMGDYSMGPHTARLRLPGAGRADICFQPDGETLIASNGGVFGTVAPSGSEGVQFTIQPRASGANRGVQRLVVFPFGGVPELRR